jgi:hypothetical protein
VTILHTQSSSKPRLQTDTLGDDALTELFRAYETHTLEDFRTLAENIVNAGSGKQQRKQEIISSMYAPLVTKTQILHKAKNFIMAGMGLGV